MLHGRMPFISWCTSSWIPAASPLQGLTSFGVLVKLWHKRLLLQKQENEICHKWLHYSRVRGRAFIVAPSPFGKEFSVQSSCQVSGRLKTVWTGHRPSQLSVLPDSDADLSSSPSHVEGLQTVSVFGSSDCLAQIYKCDIMQYKKVHPQ